MLLLAVFTLNTARGQANYIMKNNGSGTAVNTVAAYEDGSGLLGIGTTTPSSRLDVHGACGADAVLTLTRHTIGCMSGSQGDLLVANGYHSISNTTTTHFIIKGDGKVGIGTSTPNTLLHIKSRKTIEAFDGDFYGQQVFGVTNKDDEHVIIGSDMSYDNGTTNVPAGFLGVMTADEDELLALSVFNPINMVMPFVVLGSGTVGLGYDLTNSGDLIAQLDVRKHSPHDLIMNVANADNTATYFTIHNDGYVGIGYPNSGNATLQVKGNSNTLIDLMETSSTVTNNAQIRFIANNGTTVRHKITEDASGNLLLDAGVSAGSDKVKIDGDAVISKTVGIGVDVQSGVALAVKGPGDTKLDLLETSSSVDHNAQIRFIGSDGTTVRHLITEDASGNLLINAGYSTAQNKVKIDGELETTSNVVVNGTFTVVGSSANQFKVGTDGKVRAREVQVDLATIPDYVFNKDYKLPTIEQLQTFITTNRHLPNIPGECEYENQGSINLGELNLKLLEKVEELSLYIIQLNNRLKKLENE